MGRPRKNTYDISGEFGIGFTAKGEEFYFDIEDYNLIKKLAWHIDKKGYVCCTGRGHVNGKQHRIIMNVDEPEIQVDHIFHRHNDNRKSQLRIATNQQNLRNQQINKVNTSGKTGVSWSNQKNKWRSYITIDNKQRSLGYYDKYQNAVNARLAAEMKYFLEFQYAGG